MEIQTQFEDVNEEYAAFVEKFKPRKTTDDCYTPKNIYNAVADWAAAKYGFDRAQIVRPFWPGGDFERFEYPKDCVVLDNPPFSIMSRILRFYNREGIRYFLFAPGLTQFSISAANGTNFVAAHVSITYANGANVRTSFNTNMGEYLIETAPDLHRIVDALDKANQRERSKELPKYEFPDCVITAARCGWLSVHGQDYKVRREDACFIRKLDAMSKSGSGIFGGGFLLTERAAAERAAAERIKQEKTARFAAMGDAPVNAAGAICWELSPREREMQRLLAAAQKK